MNAINPVNRSIGRALRGAAACALACAAAAAVAGCGEKTKYIEANSTEGVVSIDQIDTQDWNRAASEMTQSLLNSGVLDSPPTPAVMAISRITNKTREMVDVDLLTKNIRVALNQSGKVRTSTTEGVGGVAEDPLAKGYKQQDEFYSGTHRNPPTRPDYTLSGKILETNARAGSTRDVTYTFQLSLTDRSGTAVWEDQRQIRKIGRKSQVGW